MTDKRDGGPAFPKSTVELPSGELQWGAEGMTLRDWFAGQALAGYRAASDFSSHGQAYVSEQCYRDADAMLKARDV